MPYGLRLFPFTVTIIVKSTPPEHSQQCILCGQTTGQGTTGFGNQFNFGYEVEDELSIQLENGNEVEYESSPLPFILMNLNMNLNSNFTLLSCCEVEFPIQLTPIQMN